MQSGYKVQLFNEEWFKLTTLNFLNCLILLYTYRNEFVKFPKMRIFKKQRFELA